MIFFQLNFSILSHFPANYNYSIDILLFHFLIIYLFEGALGLPVFASGGGIAYLSGPTAGYLYGMTISAVLISYLADKGFTLTYVKTIITLLLASIIIFAFGIIYLGSIIGYEKAIQVGLLPFIPSEIFKIALAVAIIPTLHNFVKLREYLSKYQYCLFLNFLKYLLFLSFLYFLKVL